MTEPARVARLDDLLAAPIVDGRITWRPVRRELGIAAFGVNAYTAASAGGELIEDHDEMGSGAARHEELYVVLRGHATFTLDGETVDAPAGTLVFCPDATTRRSAVATADGTAALAIGNPPAAAGPISPWEWYFGAAAHANRGDWQGAYDFAAQGLADHPDHPSLHYNLACYASMAGQRAPALEHLRRAVEAQPEMRGWATSDTDLDPIRDDPAFPA